MNENVNIQQIISAKIIKSFLIMYMQRLLTLDTRVLATNISMRHR